MNKDIKTKEIKRDKKGFIKSLPTAVKVFYLCGFVSAFVFVAYTFSEPFSDFVNRYISSVFRAVLAYLTGWIPFSLAEMVIILSPLIVVSLIIYAGNRFSSSWHDVLIFCTSLCSVLALFFSLFTFAFAPGYHGTTLDKKLGIERADVSAEELYDTALILADKVNEVVPEVAFRIKNFSVMPYTYGEMNDKLIDAYDKACQEYKFIQKLDSRLKPVMLSEAMSYTHITGVYTFFTGEANINVAFPDYTVPFTAAHELAHQRGISRENEASFVAFLVCIASDDSYIRYSGYLNMLEYLLSALYGASPELYYEYFEKLPSVAASDIEASYDVYYKHRDSLLGKINDKLNDAYLKANGTEGIVSYSYVVRLTVGYYQKDNNR